MNHPCIDRRSFLKQAALCAAGAACWPMASRAAPNLPAGHILVVHGRNPAAMLAAGIGRLGGWGALVKPGARVTLKPNAGWASTPAQGGNTDPTLVGACVAACLASGAARVTVPENPCSPRRHAFSMSGIEAAVTQAGGRMYQPESDRDFRRVALPQARRLSAADVCVDVLDADVLINMPVAKSHGGATLTLAMKNWMGAVRDRHTWHRTHLHQCIADFSTRVQAHLNIVDATRIMLTNGPRGPGKLDHPNQLILGRDVVAVDAFAATLFNRKPFDILHIRLAHEMGVGCGDLGRVDVEHINA